MYLFIAVHVRSREREREMFNGWCRISSFFFLGGDANMIDGEGRGGVRGFNLELPWERVSGQGSRGGRGGR